MLVALLSMTSPRRTGEGSSAYGRAGSLFRPRCLCRHCGAWPQIAASRRNDKATCSSTERGAYLGCPWLRVLQCALVYINTLMAQDVLAEATWQNSLTDADRRAHPAALDPRRRLR